MVSAADRNSDRDFHLIYGAGEHRGSDEGAAEMDGCVRIRPRARIWFLVRPSGDDAVRRIPPADFTALVQCRRRAWTDSDARAIYSRAGTSVPVRRCRTRRDDYPVGAGGAHGLALDDRARKYLAPVSISVARSQHCSARDGNALDDGARDPGRFDLAVIGAAPRPDSPRHRAQSLVSVATPAITTIGVETR